jgi:hypothetical protein
VVIVGLTDVEIQTIVTAIGAIGLLATAIATYLNSRTIKTTAITIEKNTNSTLSALTARANTAVDQRATAVELAARPEAPTAPPPTLPGPPT